MLVGYDVTLFVNKIASHGHQCSAVRHTFIIAYGKRSPLEAERQPAFWNQTNPHRHTHPHSSWPQKFDQVTAWDWQFEPLLMPFNPDGPKICMHRMDDGWGFGLATNERGHKTIILSLGQHTLYYVCVCTVRSGVGVGGFVAVFPLAFRKVFGIRCTNPNCHSLALVWCFFRSATPFSPACCAGVLTVGKDKCLYGLLWIAG